MSDWDKYTSDQNLQELKQAVASRGYSEAFVEWLATEKLLGLCDGDLANPVIGEGGEVTGCHVKTGGDWRYKWFTSDQTQRAVTPLVIGEPDGANWTFVFESPWDAFAVMSAYHWESGADDLAKGCVIITRGAQNGRLVAELLSPECVAYLWKQNDPPRGNGKLPAADRWLEDIQQNIACKIRLASTPPIYKDVNEWLQAGGTTDDVVKVVETAVSLPTLRRKPQCRIRQEPDWNDLGLVGGRDHPKEPFPTDMLPEPFAAMVKEVCRVNQIPEGLAGLLALGAISASIGSGLQAELFQHRRTRANLYLLGALPSGEGKSSTSDIMLKPIHDRNQMQLHEWRRNQLPGAKAKQACLKKSIEKLQNELGGKNANVTLENKLIEQIAAKERELEQINSDLQEPRLIVEDITTEMLAVELSRNNETLALVSSDGGDVVANLLGRYRKTNSVDDSLYVKGWSGDPISVNRINRPSINLCSPCLSTVLLVQIDKLARMLGKQQLIDGGLMPRFLMTRMVNPPSLVSVDLVGLNSEVKNLYFKIIDDLAIRFRLSRKVEVVQSSLPARQVIVDYFNEVVQLRTGELKDVSIFASRWHEQACRLTLILHAMKNRADAGNQEIQADTAQAGVNIAKWFAAEQLDILDSHRNQDRMQQLQEIWLYAETHPKGFTARELARAKFGGDSEKANVTLAAFVDKGHLLQETVQTGGRPTTRFKALGKGVVGMI